MSDDLLREFLEESHEHLARLEVDLVALEQDDSDPELLASAYRALHTLKGNCGFLALPRLERVAHAAEALLGDLRDGETDLTAARATLLLRAIDAIRAQLDALERTGQEAEGDDEALVDALEKGEALPPAPAPAVDAKPDALNVRVDVDLLDEMMTLVGELVLMRNRVLRTEIGSQQKESRRIARHQLDRLTSQLQDAVMRARMEPVGRLFDRMPRLVRDVATELGKNVRLVTSGDETELDRAILESFADPLTHLLRNAIDHGIEAPDARGDKPEAGTITLAAFRAGSQVVLEVNDDGAGIDREALRRKAREAGHPRVDDELFDPLELVFEPGLSTAETVSRISGRGVGMDVVRANVERLGGTIEIGTMRGRGTKVRIRLPLTLAIIPGIVIAAGGQRFVVPQRNLRELLRVRGRDELERVDDAPVYRLRDRLLPVVDLCDELGLQAAHVDGANSAVLAVVESDDRRFGLLIDKVLDIQEIVVKPLGRPLDRIPYYGGATTLGSGEVAIILEVGGIAGQAGVLPSAKSTAKPRSAVEPGTMRLLLADDLTGRSVLLPLDAVERIEEIWAEGMRKTGDRWVATWRDEEVPLQFLGTATTVGETERIFVAIVQSDGERRAIPLSRVRDVVTTSATGPSLVVRGEAAELIDLKKVTQ